MDNPAASTNDSSRSKENGTAVGAEPAAGLDLNAISARASAFPSGLRRTDAISFEDRGRFALVDVGEPDESRQYVVLKNSTTTFANELVARWNEHAALVQRCRELEAALGDISGLASAPMNALDALDRIHALAFAALSVPR